MWKLALLFVIMFFMYTEKAESQASKTLIIDLLTQSMAVYDENNQFVKFIRVSTGRKGFETPSGEFTVMSKDRHHKSSKYPEETNGGWPMPYALRFSGWEYWIHEGSLNSRSHGCVRVGRQDAKWLFGWVDIGTKVRIYGVPKRGVTFEATALASK